MRLFMIAIVLLMLSGCSAANAPASNVTPEIVTIVVTEYVTITPDVTAAPTQAPTPVPTEIPEPIELPLRIDGIRMGENIIGSPEVYIDVTNTSDQIIDAYDFKLRGFDAYGDPVRNYSKEFYSGTMQDDDIAPGKTSPRSWRWTLYGMDNTKRVEVAITRILLGDGTIIDIPESQWEWFSNE